MFAGWGEHPPTNILVKTLVNAFTEPVNKEADEFVVPKEAQDAMQSAAVAAIANKADPKWFPVQRGRDRGLPKAQPIFDIDELRQKNIETLKKRVLKVKQNV